jgi:hypothetical protein
MAKSARFPYTTLVDSSGGYLLRPLLSVDVVFDQRRIRTDALIDSGADANVLPYQLGLDLGANWDEARLVPALSGNLGSAEARVIVLEVIVQPFDSVRMVFIWVKSNAARLLLGQISFFQEFDVCFFGQAEFFEITR